MLLQKNHVDIPVIHLNIMTHKRCRRCGEPTMSDSDFCCPMCKYLFKKRGAQVTKLNPFYYYLPWEYKMKIQEQNDKILYEDDAKDY